MSTLDDIAQERQRLSDRLARLDAERAKLVEQLAELDAAERVLARFGHAGAKGRVARAVAAAPAGEARTEKRSRRRGGRPPRRRSGGPALGDATLRAVEALGSGISAADIRHY